MTDRSKIQQINLGEGDELCLCTRNNIERDKTKEIRDEYKILYRGKTSGKNGCV